MTKKIRIREMKCFDEVAAVIGKVDAERELFIVEDKVRTYSDAILIRSFDWHSSPQGWSFWNDINSGVNPYTGEKV